MQLLKRFLSPLHSWLNNHFPIQTGVVATSKKTVLEMFRLDINNLPLDTFSEGLVEVNTEGEVVMNYFKELDYKECGVFDKVQVKITGNKSVHIIFRPSSPTRIKDGKLKRVINDLYGIYGRDNNDQQEGPSNTPAHHPASSNKQFYALFSNNRMDNPQYKYRVSVRRDEKDISISLLRAPRKEVVEN